MRLGIDLGTTRTVVAAVDRGNYPVVSFDDDNGDAHEHFPSVVAAKNGELLYGFDALAAHANDGVPLVRSFKRMLASAEVNGAELVRVGDVEVRVIDLLTGFVQALGEAVKTRSNVPKRKGKAASSSDNGVVIAVPAHAHGAQRFLTLEAFKRAGFDVKAMINEPSAAGFEYTHNQPRTISAKRTRVVVYDLGGGTFDASLVKVDGVHHEVLGTAGLNRLGGDDFDLALLKCATRAAGIDALDARQRAALLDQCRDAKERITAQSKKIALEVPVGKNGTGGIDVNVSVDDYYEACAPLVEQTVKAMAPLIGLLADDTAGAAADDAGALAEIAGIYLVGGGSGLPLVPRMLKEKFGRRVHRSPHPGASTAIGLAIAADDEAGFALADRLSRSFGVFRETKSGRAVAFDPIFTNDALVPKNGAVVVSRRYRAAHNVGHFRFVECTAVDDGGEPRGDLVPFAEVLFPFDPKLRALGNDVRLQDVVVERCGNGPEIEERYVIDPHGLVEVQIADLESGYRQTHRIG